MNKQELIQKLQDIEWQDFEVKEARAEIPKNVWETVSAFSNTSGGWIIFGVSKRGKEYEILGVDNPEKIEQDFLSILRGEKFNRKITAKPKKYTFAQKTVLGFHIPSVYSKDKPVYYNSPSNTFIRTGSGDQRATKEEIDAMYRNSSFDKKDEQLTSFSCDDLDQDTLDRYRTYLKTVEPTHRYNNVSAKKMLELMQVVVKGKVTVGGVLAFGTSKAVNQVISDFRIEYLEVSGTSFADASDRYEYRMPIQKNLYEYYFSLLDKLLKHINIPFRLKNFSRDENPPQIIAIREALVNLLMHTDYFSNAKPRIRVLSDRIEFFNPGSLPKDIKFILKEEFSMPRNNVIARIFRTIKLSENIGSGFYKMFSGWMSYYAKKPVVEGDFDYYKIIFYLERKMLEGGENVPEKSQKSTRKVPEKYQKIINIIKENPQISRKELALKLGETEETVQSRLRKLVKESFIYRVGPDKGGHWEIK
jgi:ATP-dependent DNA helicase RecG